MTTSVAIMQPYFAPYAGYFRLFAATDVFVVYDCVQFPRRGWVHRNRFVDNTGQSQWLTLPIRHCAVATLIRDLRFGPEAAGRIAAQARRFPALTAERSDELLDALFRVDDTPVDYLCRMLERICKRLDLQRPILRSSELGIESQLKGPERILAIASHLNARHYVNAPGGRSLYSPAQFRDHGITLEFLPEHQGSYASVLERLLTEPPKHVAREIHANL